MLDGPHGRHLTWGVGISALAVYFAVAGAGAGARPAAAVRSVGSSTFFEMSPIKAVFVPSAAATRLSVAVSSVPRGNHPNFRWYLTLDHPAVGSAGRRTCENRKLAGGRRVGTGALVWANQGESFLWYAAGGSGCAGAVSVVTENEYEHCTASLAVPLPSPELRAGGPARCELGGYSIGPSTLPVPAGLLKGYAATSAELTRLAAEVRRGTISQDRLVTLVDSLLERERGSFSNLFPPVFGCRFSTVFESLVGSDAALGQQAAELKDGGVVSGTSLAAVTNGLSAAAKQLGSCETSAGSRGGAPRSVVTALERVAAEARARLRTTSSLGIKLAALATSLSAVLRDFPAVFGVPYGSLVDQAAALDSAIAFAKRQQAGDTRGAAGALAAAAAPSMAVRKGLVHHQKQVIKAENANG